MMAEKTTWIKIDRNILNWEWYTDTNTKAVFLHLLLTANIKPKRFLGVTIGRGEVATSYASLAKSLGISIKCVRTAIKHLEMGGEVAIQRHPHFSVISMPRYDYYQDNGQGTGMSTGKARAHEGQQLKNIRIEEEKNIYTPSAQTDNDTNASSLREDYGGVWLTADEYNELEGMVEDKMAFLDVLDRVGEWLKDNPRAKNRHKGVVKTFLRNDGLI